MPVDPALIMNSQLKDIEMREYLNKLSIDFLERVLPPNALYKYQPEITAINDIIYYSISHLYNQSTLGELYCGIKWMLPSLLRRHYYFTALSYIMLSSVCPYMLGVLYRKLHIKSKSPIWIFLTELFPSSGAILDKVNLFFTSILFLQSHFFELSKWVLGIKYEKIVNTGNPTISLKPIGQIIMLRLIISLISFIVRMYKMYMSAQHKPEKPISNKSSSEWEYNSQCSLCYDKITYPSAPLCGHIFCWKCIVRSLQSKAECPVCRKPSLPQQVLLLRNI